MHKILKYISENRIVRYNALLLGIALLIVTVSAPYLYRDLTRDDQQKTTELLFGGIYSSVHGDFEGPIQVAMTVGEDPLLKNLISNYSQMDNDEFDKKMTGYLSAIKDINNYSNAFIIIDKDKAYYRNDGFSKYLSLDNGNVDRWYYSFVDSGLDYATDVNTDEFNDGEWTIFVDYRVENNNGDLLGVCGVGFEMSDIMRMISEYEKIYDVTIFFTDSEGKKVLSSDEMDLETSVSVDVKLDANNEQAYWSSDGYVMSKYVEELGWFLVVKNNHSSFSIMFKKLLRYTAIILLVMIIIIIVFNYAYNEQDKRKLSKMATTDNLTAIPNRMGVLIKIDDFFERIDCKKQGAALFLIDLDHFKEVNDTLGHAVGDKVLQDIAVILMHTFRANDIVGRIGGDEFIAFCPGLKDKNAAYLKAEELNKACRKTYTDNDGNKATISISVGMSSFPANGVNYSELYEQADEALYYVKNTTRDSYEDYEKINKNRKVT